MAWDLTMEALSRLQIVGSYLNEMGVILQRELAKDHRVLVEIQWKRMGPVVTGIAVLHMPTTGTRINVMVIASSCLERQTRFNLMVYTTCGIRAESIILRTLSGFNLRHMLMKL